MSWTTDCLWAPHWTQKYPIRAQKGKKITKPVNSRQSLPHSRGLVILCNTHTHTKPDLELAILSGLPTKKWSMEFFKIAIFGKLYIPPKIWSYRVLLANVIYLRYGVLQKYHAPRTPCPFVNFTAWNTPYVCIKYYLWSTPGKRLIFVVWSTPYDVF